MTITIQGKSQIKKYLAAQVPGIAGSIGFGLGTKAEDQNDTQMQFEVDREDLTLVSYDFNTDLLVFKADIPETYAGTIYEVALYAKTNIPDATAHILTTFSSGSEAWKTGSAAAAYTSNNSRIGSDALNQTPAASSSTTSTLDGMSIDLSQNTSLDPFTVAFYNTNLNVATIQYRFKTDSANYYSITFSNPSTGYNILTATRGSATTTGAPSWQTVKTLEIVTTSKAAGASDVAFDAIRIDPALPTENLMVSRELLATPFVKQPGKTQEIEYSLAVVL